MSKENETRIHKGEMFFIRITIFGSFIANFVYVIVNIVSGVQQKSGWYVLLAIYYLALAVMGFMVIKPAMKGAYGENLIPEFKRYRLCGLILFVLNILLSIMISHLVSGGAHFSHSTIRLGIMMVYALFAVYLALMNLVQFRKYGSPLLSASRSINLTAALVTLLTLETAILDKYPPENDVTRVKIIAVTGVIVCGIVLLVSLFMLLRGTVNLSKLKKQEVSKT